MTSVLLVLAKFSQDTELLSEIAVMLVRMLVIEIKNIFVVLK